jgi:hypothetical protein
MKVKWIGIIVLLLAAGSVWFWLRRSKSSSNLQGVPAAARSQPVVQTDPPTIPNPTDLESAADNLFSANTPDERKNALVFLRSAITSGTKDAVAAALCKLLNAKKDAITGQGFKIGGNGSLLEAPTLRTWLLDQLSAVDPAAAAAYARDILNTSTSPDEWAIALRNLARGDTSSEARALLESKTSELLRNEAWQREASVGYLEAFDTAFHLGGETLLPPLTELVSKKDNQAVAHAAFLTLDRLVINQPAQTLAVLNEHPEWMAGREETRANYFARADVGDAAQRQLVEAYLLDAARGPAELQAFAGVYPNANFMISHNLLTSNATLDGATLARRDQAALAVVNQWLNDPRFEKLRPHLEKMKARLGEFTNKSEGVK